jgi:hypothetical protein
MFKRLTLIYLITLTLVCAGCPSSDKWNVLIGALDGAPALIDSFGVAPEISKELKTDFAAAGAAARAWHSGQGTAATVTAALDKLQLDGSRLLSGANGARILAIVAFLRPFIPQGIGQAPTRSPTDQEVKEFKDLLRPIGQ